MGLLFERGMRLITPEALDGFRIFTNIGTVQGAVATWRPCETRTTQGPGRYRSLYRTDGECFDLTRAILSDNLVARAFRTTFLKAPRDEIRAAPRFIVRLKSLSNKLFPAPCHYCPSLRRRSCGLILGLLKADLSSRLYHDADSDFCRQRL